MLGGKRAVQIATSVENTAWDAPGERYRIANPEKVLHETVSVVVSGAPASGADRDGTTLGLQTPKVSPVSHKIVNAHSRETDVRDQLDRWRGNFCDIDHVWAF